MLLAGDLGGTKTLLGLFEAAGDRPAKVAARAYQTRDFPNFVAMIEDFRRAAGWDHPIDSACFGVAGPVVGNVGHLTNVPWRIEAERLVATLDTARVCIINDLAALAHAVPLLREDELHTLQRGLVRRDGNIAVIAAGTGLGEALLHRVNGRYIPSPGEGGHADFAPRNEREIAVLRELTARFGRASVEHVVSGPGLVNLYRVTHGAGSSAGSHDAAASAADISRAALAGTCRACVEAFEIFVDAYGAECGNLALRSLATGGVFIGGGIAPKILPALGDGRFMRAFVAKAPHTDLLSAMPVHVIINGDAGLLGAAVCARTLMSG
jgi:glucokinase